MENLPSPGPFVARGVNRLAARERPGRSADWRDRGHSLARLGEDPVRPLPARGHRWGAVATELASGNDRALLVRLCTSVWFLVLSATSFRDANGLLEHIAAGRAGPGAWPALLSEGCIVVFYTIICCIMLIRPEPVSRAEGLGPALLAMAGTYAAWLIPLLPRGSELPALYVASAAIILISEVLIVYTLLSLGRSFSLIPQARKLVTSGPYAMVRHPLYLVEEIAVAGVLLQYAWSAALPFLALHVTVQIRRMQLEEKVLQNAFPEYATYVRHTPRLIPGVW
jgi:protein-S-isoprenylcysteine O-methyltransferase Ste14